MKTCFQYFVITLALLAGNCQVLAATAFPIASNMLSGGVATSGSNYLVCTLSGTNVGVQLVSASGTLVGSRLTLGNSKGFPLISFGETNYLAVWADDFIQPQPALDLFGQLISAGGTKIGSPFPLLSSLGTHGFQAEKAIIFDGTHFLVVWEDDSGDGNSAFYGQMVAPDGSLFGAEFPIAGGQFQDEEASLSLGSANALFSWQTRGNDMDVTYGVLISRNGTVGSPFQISQTLSKSYNPLASAFDGNNYFVVWNKDIGAGYPAAPIWNLYGRLIAPDGSLPGNEMVLVTNQALIPSLDFGGPDYLLEWSYNLDTTNANKTIFYQFFDPSASPVGSAFNVFQPQGANRPIFGGLVFDGTRHLTIGDVGVVNVDTNGHLQLVSSTIYGTFIPTGWPMFFTQPQSRTNFTGANATFSVVAGPSPLTYQWRKNGVKLMGGSHLAGVTSSMLTINSLITTDAGTYSVAISNLLGGLISSNAILTALVPDTTKPTTSITAPSANQRWSNAVFTVAGKAADNIGVSNVFYSVNNSGWLIPSTANRWSNWTAQVALIPGTNQISAYAIDTSGNYSTTNQVKLVYVLSATLTVGTNGGGAISPNLNGALLQIGAIYSLIATPKPGFSFVNWTDGSSLILTNHPTLKFLMASNLTFVANFTDTGKPTNFIASPSNNQHWSNDMFTVTGKAADNVAVSGVFVSLNGSAWNLAATGNAWSNWTAQAALTPGTNAVSAYAVDSSGNVSATNIVKWVYVLSAPLVVNTNGRGTISPNYNNALLQIGARYTLTATPALGFSFTNWQDGNGNILTNRPALTFLMVSNLTFSANFADITKPTLSIAYPTAKQSVSNSLINVTGMAKDNVAVSAVWYQLNGGIWNLATTANNWSNWMATVALMPGTNVVDVYSIDASGNVSLTNAVSFFLQRTQILETVSQTISASAGGIITLPSGSFFSIPPGVMTNDMVVTLSLMSTLTKQPPSGIIVGVGPALVLSFAPVPQALANSKVVPKSGPTPASQPQLTLVYGGNNIAGVAGSAALMDAVDLTAGDQFIGIPGNSANNSVTFYPPLNFFQSPNTLQFSLGNISQEAQNAAPPSTGGVMWNPTFQNWVNFDPQHFDPTKRTVVVVHGFFSTVQKAFGPCMEAIIAAGGYEQVVGFNYNDWDLGGVQANGQQLAAFINSLGIPQVDIIAHSKGGPVSLAGGCGTTVKIGHMVLLGSPLMGSPIADSIEGQLTFLMNSPKKNGAVQKILSTSIGLFLNTPWAQDFETTSPTMANLRACFDATHPATETKLVLAAGENPVGSPEPFLQTFGAVMKLVNLFKEPFDMLVGQSSALATDWQRANISRSAFPNLSHTQLECDPNVVAFEAANLNRPQPAILLSPTQLHFTAIQGGSAPPSQSFTIKNDGASGSILIYAPVTSSSSWLGLSGQIIALATEDSVSYTVTANPAGLTSGIYNATIAVSDTIATNITQSIPVTLTISPQPQYTLNITVTPPGSGSVTASPPGLTYVNGTVVTLTAAANAGYLFTRWNGGVSGTGNAMVIMTTNKNVTATFIQTYTLTIVTNGGTGTGTVTANPPGLVYTNGTRVTLTAKPDAGSKFINWSGAVSGTTTNILIVINGNQSVTATFNNTNLPPVISLNPIALNFSATEGGSAPASQTFTIKNVGPNSSILNYAPVTSTAAWVGLSGSAIPLSAGQSTTYTVTANPSGLTAAGSPYTSTLQVSDSNATNSPQNVQVNFVIAAAATPPSIRITSVISTVVDHNSLWTDYSVTVQGTTTGNPGYYTYQAGWGIFGVIDNTLNSNPENWSFSFSFTQFAGSPSTYKIWAEEYGSSSTAVSSDSQYITFRY